MALGASPFVMQATESLLTVTFNVSLQKYGGDLAVGAMTILTSVAQMVQMPLMGLAQGAQPILSFNYGAGRPDRMKQSVRYTLVIACVFAFAVWGLVQLAPHVVAQLFNRSTELVDITAWALRIYFAVGFTMAFQNTFQQSFVALGEAKISLFLALERKVILLIPLISSCRTLCRTSCLRCSLPSRWRISSLPRRRPPCSSSASAISCGTWRTKNR